MTAPLHTVPEAAALLRVSESWLRKRIAAHAIEVTHFGRAVRLTDQQLSAAVESHTVPAVRRLRSSA